jgi:hypothetical protein
MKSLDAKAKELRAKIARETNKAKAIKKPYGGDSLVEALKKRSPEFARQEAARDKAIKARAKIEAAKKPTKNVLPKDRRNVPRPGRDPRVDKHLMKQKAWRLQASKPKVPTVHGEIQKASGAIQKVGSATAKSAVRSNSLLSRVARGATSVAKTAGKGLMALADSGPGARLAAKVGAKVAGRVLVPLGLAADAVAIAGAGTEGVRALKAQHDARKEKQGSEAKYGTVEAATRTRHARRDARRKAAADRAGGPKVNV